MKEESIDARERKNSYQYITKQTVMMESCEEISIIQ
jgi:hypothetical protein